ncbi:MAG: paraquat-inducible protein A [Burkholderiaceae bacterium]
MRQLPPESVRIGGGMIACRHCDLLQRAVELPANSSAYCVRCRARLYRGQRITLDLMLAYALAAFALFVVANLFPIALLSAQGFHSSTTLVGTVQALYGQDKPMVAAVVLLTTVAIPGLELLALLYMLLPLRLGVVPPGLPFMFRFLLAAHPWSMIEVFLLGILVTLVKLADLATVVPGLSLWAFVGLIGMFSAISASFSIRDFWCWVEAADRRYHFPACTESA